MKVMWIATIIKLPFLVINNWCSQGTIRSNAYKSHSDLIIQNVSQYQQWMSGIPNHHSSTRHYMHTLKHSIFKQWMLSIALEWYDNLLPLRMLTKNKSNITLFFVQQSREPSHSLELQNFWTIFVKGKKVKTSLVNICSFCLKCLISISTSKSTQMQH